MAKLIYSARGQKMVTFRGMLMNMGHWVALGAGVLHVWIWEVVSQSVLCKDSVPWALRDVRFATGASQFTKAKSKKCSLKDLSQTTSTHSLQGEFGYSDRKLTV